MATISIVPNAPFCTKKKLAEITGWSISSIERKLNKGEIPIIKKESGKTSVLINLVKLYEQMAEQEV